ncbi:MAG: MFS transporter [Bacteroidales bacterium]
MEKSLFSNNLGVGSFLMLKISIWSVSILTSITGLAISPSLPEIQQKFPHVGKTEIDMLISLPNLLLIPFVIIAGKLAQSNSKTLLIRIGTLFFLGAAIAYQFANSISTLLIISILLGLGAGFVVPLAAQLPSVVFRGAERQKQMGICSGISNAAQVLCTFLAGWLATINWHAPFWVYSLAIIPLLLSPFLQIEKYERQQPSSASSVTAADPSPVISGLGKSGINIRQLIQLMILYFIVMFFNLQIPISLPFLLSHHHIDTTISGSLISIFFLVQAGSAFLINNIIRCFGKKTMVFALFVISVCLFLFPFVKSVEWYYLLAAFAGITGGTIEPLIWNKTSQVSTPEKSTVAFGWIMSACYLCIWATPYILNLLSDIFHNDLSTFPFFVSGGISILFTVVLLFSQNQTVFGMKREVELMKKS